MIFTQIQLNIVQLLPLHVHYVTIKMSKEITQGGTWFPSTRKLYGNAGKLELTDCCFRLVNVDLEPNTEKDVTIDVYVY
jgi:hypothetical protein